jgi:hypothetical protein
VNDLIRRVEKKEVRNKVFFATKLLLDDILQILFAPERPMEV